MHEIVLFKLGGRYLHLLKLIGAFIVIAAALMLLSDVYRLMWAATIVEEANSGIPHQITASMGSMSITQTLQPNDSSTQLGLMLVPLAGIMFWAAFVVAGGVIYRSGQLVVPVEKTVSKITVIVNDHYVRHSIFLPITQCSFENLLYTLCKNKSHAITNLFWDLF